MEEMDPISLIEPPRINLIVKHYLLANMSHTEANIVLAM